MASNREAPSKEAATKRSLLVGLIGLAAAGGVYGLSSSLASAQETPSTTTPTTSQTTPSQTGHHCDHDRSGQDQSTSTQVAT